MRQVSFDPLDYNEDTKVAQRARREYKKEMEAKGVKCDSWTLPNQLKKYAGLGQYDGRVRNVYYLNVWD